jgi:glycine C-acetyltransferase
MEHKYFKAGMKNAGFDYDGDSAIVPVMLYDKLSQTMADELLKKEFMLLGSFSVVPKDKARIRVQLSAAH